jgi:hypothetical protein
LAPARSSVWRTIWPQRRRPNVLEHKIGAVNASVPSEFDRVTVFETRWKADVTPSDIKAGYPAHILFDYKSPGFLAEEEKRRHAAN